MYNIFLGAEVVAVRGSLFQFPVSQIEIPLDSILNIVGQVAEEVDACTPFQFVNADGILRTHFVRITLMLHPESDSIVTTIGLHILLGICEDGHIEVLRANHLSAASFPRIVPFRNRSALDHVECVAEA